MVETVRTLTSNYRDDKTAGAMTTTDAREALKTHRGDIWAAVTNSVERRQAKVSCNDLSWTRLPRFRL